MILICQPQRRESPRILDFIVERKTVVHHWKRSRVRENFEGAREIVAQRGFEFLAPARSSWWKPAHREIDGRRIESRIQSAASAESDFLRIEFVKVVENAADGKTFVIVDGVLEEPHRDRAAVEHQILANI